MAIAPAVPTAIVHRFITCREFRTTVTPLGFLVHRAIGNSAQRANEWAIGANEHAREGSARWFIHERHKLVREPGHRAGNTNATDIRTAANAIHPPAFGDVAIN